MRTTVTLDPDVEALLRKHMRQHELSFKQALNSALRAGLAGNGDAAPFSTPTFAMGFDPSLPLDKALRLAEQLEDEELVRKHATRK